jgi:hypothetical protein
MGAAGNVTVLKKPVRFNPEAMTLNGTACGAAFLLSGSGASALWGTERPQAARESRNGPPKSGNECTVPD